MILLIGDYSLCSLSTTLSNTGQKIAFLQTNEPLFSQNLGNALEDAALEIAVIECVLHEHQGLALLRKIKQNRHDVPVIFICPSDSDRTVAEAFRLGAWDCFRKPVDVLRLPAGSQNVEERLIHELPDFKANFHKQKRGISL